MKNRTIKNTSVGKLVRRQQASRIRRSSVAAEWPVDENYQPAALKQLSGGESVVAVFAALSLLLGPVVLFGIYSLVCSSWLLMGLLWWLFQPVITRP